MTSQDKGGRTETSSILGNNDKGGGGEGIKKSNGNFSTRQIGKCVEVNAVLFMIDLFGGAEKV